MRLKEYDEYSFENVIAMLFEINGYSGEFEDLIAYEFDEYILDELFANVYDAVTRMDTKNFNVYDDYVKFNNYGNLITLSESEYENEIEDYKNDILETYLEYVNSGNLKNDSDFLIENI